MPVAPRVTLGALKGRRRIGKHQAPESKLEPPDLYFQSPRFRTTLAHWVLPWPEWRHLPESIRPLARRFVSRCLPWKVSVPGGFSFSGQWSWRDARDLDVQRRLWRDIRSAHGHSTRVRWLGLLEHCGSDGAVRVRILRPSTIRFVLLCSNEGTPLAYARRYWHPQQRHMEHALIAVAASARGGSVGTQILANSIALYRDLDIRTVGLTAGLSAGGAVWPLFGFRPTTRVEWERVKAVIRKNYLRLPPEAAQAYEGGPHALRRAVSAILQDPHTDGIWSVVDLDPSRIAARAGKLPHSLGAWLLQGSRWKGVLDLQRPEAVARLRNYLSDRLKRGVITTSDRW